MTEAELDRRRYAVELLKRTELQPDWAAMPGIIALAAKLVDLIEADIGALIEAYATEVDGMHAVAPGFVRTVKDLIDQGHHHAVARGEPA